MPPGWTLPAVEDVNREWFTSGTLAVQTCASCGVLQHPPEEICPACGAMSFVTTTVPGEGTVHSFTVVHHPVHQALEDAVPYTVVLVSLDAAPELRVVGNLLGAPGVEVAIGMPVEAVWSERASGDEETVLLPQWQRRT